MKISNKHSFFTPIFLLLASAALFTACDRDKDPEPEHEHELITTVVLTLTNAANATEVVTATWRDLDGAGGDPPTVDEVELAANTTYRGTISLLHEHAHGEHFHGDDLTADIREEANDHEFFYTPSSGLNLTVTKTDVDSQGRPVGLEATFVAGAHSHGNLRVRLMHQAGTKPNPGSPNVGETDLDITFPVHIE